MSDHIADSRRASEETHQLQRTLQHQPVAVGSQHRGKAHELNDIAEALFSQLAVDGFFLEYDDERSGGFEPLRFVPKGKMVVLGLVTTKRPQLESGDDLKRRVDEAARYVPLDQVCLSGQCGFSSTVEGNALTYDEQVAKLRLIAETAREVWG